MAPIFPHISEELWQQLNPESASVHQQAWPQSDPAKAREDEITVVVQVNGKVRDKLVVTPGTDQDVLQRAADPGRVPEMDRRQSSAQDNWWCRISW